MEIDIEQDIVSVTDLKRRTKSVIEHVHGTRRPVVITVNGRADVVLMSAKTYETLKRGADIVQGLQHPASSVTYDTEKSLHTDPMNGQSFRKFKDFSH